MNSGFPKLVQSFFASLWKLLGLQKKDLLHLGRKGWYKDHLCTWERREKYPSIIGRSRNYPLTLWSSRIFIVCTLFPFFFFTSVASIAKHGQGSPWHCAEKHSPQPSPQLPTGICLAVARKVRLTFAYKFPVLWSLTPPPFSLINRSD